MEKKKLTLEDLKLESFLTELDDSRLVKVQGGLGGYDGSETECGTVDIDTEPADTVGTCPYSREECTYPDDETIESTECPTTVHPEDGETYDTIHVPTNPHESEDCWSNGTCPGKG